MPTILLYLLKLSISLSVAWLFYRLVLRNLTFYRLNRWYLLGYSLLSLFIPFVNIGAVVGDSDVVSQPRYIQFIPVVGNYTPAAALPARTASGLSPWTFVLLGLVVGMMILLTRTFILWSSLARIKRQARLISSDTGIRIYQVDQPITPFSFGNALYINPRLHSEKEWDEIILHEYVHIRQRHTIDILLAEGLCILNWYNPFAWALRHSIRQNLEFIADQNVLDNGVDKKGYQYHLLKVLGHPRYRLANNFNFSSLKKRIIMMNKIRSARLHLLRFLFLLPLLTMLLLAFRTRYPHFPHGKTAPVYVNAAGIVISLPAKTPLKDVTVREKRTGLQTTTDANGYYKLQIPVTTDSIRIDLNFTKQGYEAGVGGRFFPTLKQTTGIIDVAALESPHVKLEGIFMVVPNFEAAPPVDPGYKDALSELHRVLKENDQLNNFVGMEKTHPEVGLFYIAEDKQKGLVIHTDGSVERFGYAGSPAFTTMGKKYGPLPAFMLSNAHPVNPGYLAHWAAISAQAEKEFHPTGGNPRAIIFPGDSRVIAVPAAGKPQIYDMDNTNDAKERPAFEKLYGPLPACVPGSGTVPAVSSISRPQKPTTSVDSIPAAAAAYMPKINGDPVIVVDGVRKADSVDALARLDPSMIESITVLKDSASAAKYGPSASARGVVLISTKNSQKQP